MIENNMVNTQNSLEIQEQVEFELTALHYTNCCRITLFQAP